jgi:hypothetical protein
MAWFALLLFVSFLGWSIYGWLRSKRSLTEAGRIQERLREAARTSIREAPASGRIVISGHVQSATGDVVTAPFSGGEALWARARLKTNIGDVMEEWTRQVGEIVVDDGSGRVARVDPSSVRMRLSERSADGSEASERIAAFLASTGKASRSGFAYESVLRPGDHASVMGSVARSDAGYRQGSDALRFSSDDEPVLFDPMVEPTAEETARRLMGCALFGVVLFAIAAAITLAILIRG